MSRKKKDDAATQMGPCSTSPWVLLRRGSPTRIAPCCGATEAGCFRVQTDQ